MLILLLCLEAFVKSMVRLIHPTRTISDAELRLSLLGGGFYSTGTLSPEEPVLLVYRRGKALQQFRYRLTVLTLWESLGSRGGMASIHTRNRGDGEGASASLRGSLGFFNLYCSSSGRAAQIFGERLVLTPIQSIASLKRIEHEWISVISETGTPLC